MRLLLTACFMCISIFAIATEPVLLWNTTGDRASFDQMREALEAAGGHAQHAYIPHFLAGRIAPEHLMGLPATVEVLILHGDRSLLASAPEDAQRFAEAWTMAMLKQLQPREIPENLPPLVDDVIEIPIPEKGSMGQARDRDIPYGAEDTDTSQYMIGDVSVCLFLPESNDSVCLDGYPDNWEWVCTSWGEDSEDWTAQEVQEVEYEVINAMDWWAAREADSHLTFVYNFYDTIPIEFEMINWPHTYHSLMPHAAMETLGYEGDFSNIDDRVYEYLLDTRLNDSADWGFLVFVVDSSNDADGCFSDGRFAFAVTHGDGGGGGPYQVMTYDNDSYGLDNMDAVCAHETGHIFGAGDQYGTCSCQNLGGYLYFENQNCVNDCLLDEESIMRGQVYPFTVGAVDYYARGQVGWQDTDADGILDIEDTHPLLTMPPSPDQTEFSFQLTGSAEINPMDAVNPYYNTSSINTISAVEYRLNGGDWLSGIADDGVFDDPEEAFTLDITVTENGTYTIECRAENNMGNLTDPVFIDEFEVDTATDTPDTPRAFRLNAAVPNPFNPSTSIQYHLPYETETTLTVLDLSGRTVMVLASGHQEAGSHIEIWDGTDGRGKTMASGVYFYRMEAPGFTQTRKMTLLK